MAIKILEAQVFHKRYKPRENSFNYKVDYLLLDLAKLPKKQQKLSGFSLVNFSGKKHGKRDGADLSIWVKELCQKHNIDEPQRISLLTLPEICGWVFNPVSFYYCFDKQDKLYLVLAEVNNTFKETHTYLCHKQDFSEIDKTDILIADKVFHVSPFYERKGSYKFRFAYQKKQLAIWIDYFDLAGKLELKTSVIGKLEEPNLRKKISLLYGLVFYNLRVLFLIHFQALRLVLKRIKYIAKPHQKTPKYSVTKN